MNRTAVALAIVTAGMSFASVGSDESPAPAACGVEGLPPCVDQPAPECEVQGSLCSLPALLERNAVLTRQVYDLDMQALGLRGQVARKDARIEHLRERLNGVARR